MGKINPSFFLTCQLLYLRLTDWQEGKVHCCSANCPSSFLSRLESYLLGLPTAIILYCGCGCVYQMGSTAETRCNEHAGHINLQHLIKSEIAEQKPQNKLGENNYTGRSNWVCRPYMVRVMKDTIKATVLLAKLIPVWVTEKFRSYCETRMLIAVFLRACTCSCAEPAESSPCPLLFFEDLFQYLLPRTPSSFLQVSPL
jgi:hypothetical protein